MVIDTRSLVTCLQISKHCKELGDVDDSFLVNFSLTALLSHNQFPSLLFKVKFCQAVQLFLTQSVRNCQMPHSWERSNLDTIRRWAGHVVSGYIEKKTSHSGGELNGYLPLKTLYARTGRITLQKQTTWLIHWRKVSDLCMHIRKIWKATCDSVKLFCAGKHWALAVGSSESGAARVQGSPITSASPMSLLLQQVSRRRRENGESLSAACTHQPACWGQRETSRWLREMIAESVCRSLTRLAR